jgi:hypothetical protein
MPLPLADVDKRPVVFLDSLGAGATQVGPLQQAATKFIADLHRAFDVLYVLTSNVAAGRSHEEVISELEQHGLLLVAKNLHTNWSTPFDVDSDLAEQIEAWHATSSDRTPTSYVIIAPAERGASIQGDSLAEYATLFDGIFTEADYKKACQILHSQLSFEPFNSDWY